MINLQAALAADVAEGVRQAQEKGVLPKVSALPFDPVQGHLRVEKAEAERGDYASPVALSLTKPMKKPPMDIVAAIAEHMPKKEYVGKIEAAAPGFLNIRLNPGWMTARLDDVVEQDMDEGINVGGGRRINFEFISANPTGPLTIGNVRTAFTVDTLANVLTHAGFSVTREYYINDAGGQIMKLGESVIRRALQARGESVDYPESLYQGDYVRSVAATVAEELAENEGKEFTASDIEDGKIVERAGQRAASLLMAEIKRTIAEDLKINIDVWTSEAALRDKGAVKEVEARLRQRGMLYTKEGATYLKTQQYGDAKDRVFIKKDGEYAYIAPDAAYHFDKYQRGFDTIYTFVGADHIGLPPKLTAAMAALGCEVDKLHVVVAQWIRFVQDNHPVKFSKRAGVIVTPKELIDQVGYDVARYFMIMHALSTHMDFDLTLAQERSEKNPVYYIQYAYVRLQSILRRAKQEGIIMNVDEQIELTSHAALTHTKELEVMRELYRYPEVVADIAARHEVHRLAYYAYDLAGAVHSFYKHVPVLKSGTPETLRSRLQLVLAARKVLGHTLDLLGLSKPDVM